MQLKFALVLTVIVTASVSQAQSADTRLASAATLWAKIHYSHPWLAGKEIDWDAAFAAAAPKIVAAQSKQQYREAVSEMLLALGDPATYVDQREPRPDSARPRDPSFRRENGIVIFDPGIGGPAPFQKLVPALLTELGQEEIRGMVIDARNSPSFVQRWSDDITAHSAPGLVSVGRVWSGYPSPQSGAGYGGYSHALSSQARPPVTGSPKGCAKPIVILADRRTNLPPALVALQVAGKVAIVLEGPHSHDAVVPQQAIPLGEGLTAVVRTLEFTHADGTYGFVPQRELEIGGLGAALEIAETGNFPAVTRPRGFLMRRFVEKDYADQPYPREGLRMLGALRVWSVFENFFPYKHLIGEDWDAVLVPALREAREAKDALAYHLAIARLVARTNDTHCGVNSSVLSQHWGTASPPFLLRWVENRPVVTTVGKDGAAAGVRLGDVLIAIDGRPFLERMEEIGRYRAASTPQSKRSVTLYAATTGADGSTARVTLEGEGGARREVEVTRRAANFAELRAKDGPVYRKLDARTGYADLTRLEIAQVSAMFEEFQDTQALILDMRGYPRGTAWSIAPRLSAVESPVNAQFRRNLLNYGEQETMLFEQKIPPRGGAPLYKGRTVLLIDERAVSQSEHSGLMYRTANGTQFIGEPTTGANGDVTFFFAPGGIRISFSGHDVRWPDGTQLQRIGLKPDVPAAPTIAGIRTGRDEVLEKALEVLRK